jgi:hypothetical protein
MEGFKIEEILGEFVALGVLYHSKHLERFMERKA